MSLSALLAHARRKNFLNSGKENLSQENIQALKQPNKQAPEVEPDQVTSVSLIEDDDEQQVLSQMQQLQLSAPQQPPEQRHHQNCKVTYGKGFEMMKKMGWDSGQGLGKDKQGRKTPVPSWKNVARQGFKSPSERYGKGNLTTLWSPEGSPHKLVKPVPNQSTAPAVHVTEKQSAIDEDEKSFISANENSSSELLSSRFSAVKVGSPAELVPEDAKSLTESLSSAMASFAPTQQGLPQLLGAEYYRDSDSDSDSDSDEQSDAVSKESNESNHGRNDTDQETQQLKTNAVKSIALVETSEENIQPEISEYGTVEKKVDGVPKETSQAAATKPFWQSDSRDGVFQCQTQEIESEDDEDSLIAAVTQQLRHKPKLDQAVVHRQYIKKSKSRFLVVVDSNVLINELSLVQSLKNYSNVSLLIPIAVIRELDFQKTGRTLRNGHSNREGLAFQARQALHFLNSLTSNSSASIEGSNKPLKVHFQKPFEVPRSRYCDRNYRKSNDDRILDCSLYFWEKAGADDQVILATNDVALQLKARGLFHSKSRNNSGRDTGVEKNKTSNDLKVEKELKSMGMQDFYKLLWQTQTS